MCEDEREEGAVKKCCGQSEKKIATTKMVSDNNSDLFPLFHPAFIFVNRKVSVVFSALYR